jgi:prepilin-type N-terminal cleavage/methylation domain-containing protein/prepilin-type processing-associated H-X9-DG protein
MSFATQHYRPRPRGFTLVELLVVIGIIALLIGILLPSLNAAREQARMVKCASNMRQLAVAAALYANSNKNTIPPADIDLGPPYVDSSNGRTWNDTWATLLVAGRYVNYPHDVKASAPPSLDNVFGCPSGLLEMSQVTFGGGGIPATRTDQNGAMGYLHQSAVAQPGLNVFVWFGVNGTSSSAIPADAGTATDKYIPCKRITRVGNATKGWVKITQIRRPSELVFLFDGLLGLNYHAVNANRINARHKSRSMTNVAFFDGHVESIFTKEIPGGLGDANATANNFSLDTCNRFRRVLWRMDQ